MLSDARIAEMIEEVGPAGHWTRPMHPEDLMSALEELRALRAQQQPGMVTVPEAELRALVACHHDPETPCEACCISGKELCRYEPDSELAMLTTFGLSAEPETTEQEGK